MRIIFISILISALLSNLSAQNPYDGIWVSDIDAEFFSIIKLDQGTVTIASRTNEIKSEYNIKLVPIKYSIITQIGDCLFYFNSEKQAFIYFTTYTNNELVTYSEASDPIKYKKVTLNELSNTEISDLNNAKVEPGIMWHSPLPQIEGFWKCDESK